MVEVHLEKIPGKLDSATVLYWAVEEGDRIEKGEPLAKFSIDGKAFTLFSSATGVIHEIYYIEGEEVSLNDVIATIEEDEGPAPGKEEELDVEEVV